MKTVCIKALVVVLFIVLFDIVVGILCNSIYDKLTDAHCCKSGQVSIKNYALNVVTCDVLITGSSPAAEAFDSEIMEDSLSYYMGKSLSVSNVAFSLQRIPWNYCTIMSIIERQPPKAVIMDVNGTTLNQIESYGTISILRDFYYRNKYVKEVLDDYDNPRERFFYSISSLYRFRTSAFSLPTQLFKPIVKDGFMPKDFIINPSEIDGTDDKDTSPADSSLIKYFDKIINTCKANNVQLIVTLSPKLYLSDKESESYTLLISICKENCIPIIDMENDERFSDYHLFCDLSHLNKNGSISYSSIMSKYISEILKGKASVDSNSCIRL